MNGEPASAAASARNRIEGALRLVLPIVVLALGVLAWELVVRLRGIPPGETDPDPGKGTCRPGKGKGLGRGTL